MKCKILAFGLIALLLLGAMAYLYLFRTEVANNPKIGIMTYYYSWPLGHVFVESLGVTTRSRLS